VFFKKNLATKIKIKIKLQIIYI